MCAVRRRRRPITGRETRWKLVGGFNAGKKTGFPAKEDDACEPRRRKDEEGEKKCFSKETRRERVGGKESATAGCHGGETCCQGALPPAPFTYLYIRESIEALACSSPQPSPLFVSRTFRRERIAWIFFLLYEIKLSLSPPSFNPWNVNRALRAQEKRKKNLQPWRLFVPSPVSLRFYKYAIRESLLAMITDLADNRKVSLMSVNWANSLFVCPSVFLFLPRSFFPKMEMSYSD